MTLFDGAPLLVSFPGGEIERIDWPGSIADPERVLAAGISPDLHAALGLLTDKARRLGAPIHCVARPEMFTHGVTAAWLRDQVGETARHVCLTDGSTFKPIPGARDHLFFYRSSRRDDVLALDRLCRRAPRLMVQVQGQIKSCFDLGRGMHRVWPTSIFVHRTRPREHPRPRLLRFYLNRDSAEDSANRIEEGGAIDEARVTQTGALRYLPLTETAMADRAFARFVGDAILDACFDASTLLVLRLPSASGLATGIGAILPAPLEAGVVIPRARRDHILVTVDDLEEDHSLFNRHATHIMVHESFDFWRHTASFYARADRVTVLAGTETTMRAGFIPYDVSTVYGGKAVRRWLVDPAADD